MIRAERTLAVGFAAVLPLAGVVELALEAAADAPRTVHWGLLAEPVMVLGCLWALAVWRAPRAVAGPGWLGSIGLAVAVGTLAVHAVLDPPPALHWQLFTRHSILAAVLAVALVHLRSIGAIQDVTFWFSALLIGVLVHAALVLLSIGLAMAEGPVEVWNHLAVTVGHLRVWSFVLAVGLGLAAGLALAGQRWAWVAVVVMGALCGWCGGRAALVGVIAGAPLMAFAVPWRRAATVAAAGLGGVLASALLPAPAGTFGTVRRLFVGYERSEAGYGSGRTQVWRESIEVWLQSPWFGHGWLQFGAVGESDLARSSFHTHSMPLEFLVAGGIIGGGAAMALMAGLIWRLLRTAEGPLAAGALWGLAGLASASLFDAALIWPVAIAYGGSLLVALTPSPQSVP